MSNQKGNQGVEVARALIEYIERIGLFKQLITDQGGEFLGTNFEKLVNRFNIHHSQVSTKSSFRNSKIEKANDTWREIFKKLVSIKEEFLNE